MRSQRRNNDVVWGTTRPPPAPLRRHRLSLSLVLIIVVVVLKVNQCNSFLQFKKGTTTTLPTTRRSSGSHGIQLSSSSSSSHRRRRKQGEEKEPNTNKNNQQKRKPTETNQFQKLATLGGILGSNKAPKNNGKESRHHGRPKLFMGGGDASGIRKNSKNNRRRTTSAQAGGGSLPKNNERERGPRNHSHSHRHRNDGSHKNSGQQQQQHKRQHRWKQQGKIYDGQPHDRFISASEFNQWLQHRINKSTGHNNNFPRNNNPTNVQMAEEALWERIHATSSSSSSLEKKNDHHQQHHGNKDKNNKKDVTLKYTTISFNIILNGWAKQRSVFAAERADQLLHQLLQLQQQNKFLQADTYSYSAVLNAYAKSGGGKSAALRAEELLTQMLVTSSSSSIMLSSSPSSSSSNEDLNHNNSNNKKQSTAAAAVKSADVCYNAVMDAWSVSGDSQAGERAESILRKCPKPSRISYNACIKAYARSQSPIEAQRLLEEMTLLSSSSSSSSNSSSSASSLGQPQDDDHCRPELEPDKISISTCIDAWSKWDKNLTYAALQAESLLTKMEHDYEEWNRTHQYHEATPSTQTRNKNRNNNNNNKQPDVKAYTAALTAYARAGWPEASKKALQLIHRMEKYSDQRPNAPFFNTIIHMLAKSKTTTTTTHGAKKTTKTTKASETSPEQMAEGILQHMKDQFERTQNEEIRPTVITYTAVIAVIAAHCSRSSSSRSNNYGGQLAAAENAERLLNELETLYNTTKLEVYLPNTKTFGAVLSVWAKVSASTTMSDEEEATISGDSLWQRAETLLERMEGLYNRTGSEELQPTSILYSQVFRILANGRDPNAATRGLELMKRLKTMNESKTKYGEQIRLDSTMYAYLIVTFTKSKVDNVVEVATRILEEVEEGYRNGMGDLKPTSLLYSAVLQAYAKSASKEGAELAEQLLAKTKDLYKQGKMYAKPTTLFYNAVIDAHARSTGGLESAERAEELLDEMEVRGRVGDSELCLTTRSYNAAILAWKNSNCTDAPERAEALLKKMSAKYKAGDERCRPDRVTINSIIGVWAKSPKEGAAVRAEEFLRFMEQQFHQSESKNDPIKPDRYSYNSVIDAYSRSPDPGAARRAQALFDRMKALYEEGGERDLKPDLITLTSLRKAWMGSNDDDQAKLYQRKVGEMILKEVDRQRKAKRYGRL